LTLFCALNATDEQLDFPVIYASGRNGYAIKELEDPRVDLTPLLDMIVDRAYRRPSR
jgi:GTP-binding protein